MSGSWNQEKVYRALVNRRNETKKSEQDRYVKLYDPQPQNAAILYEGPSGGHPVHLNHRRCEDYWEKIKPCLPYLKWEARDQSKQTPFDKYSVDDWDAFARALG